MKDAVWPEWYPWETARRGEWRGTQSGPWLLCKPPPDGNCVATVSVRPAVVADGPERVKPAVPLPVSGNCAAAVWGSGRSLLSARPQGVKTAKRFSRSAGESVRRVRESGMPSCFCKPPPCVSPWSRDTALGLDTWWNAPCAPVGRYSTPGMGFPDETRPCAPVGRYSTPGMGFPDETRPCAPVGRYSAPGIGIPGEAHRAPRWVGIPRLGLGSW